MKTHTYTHRILHYRTIHTWHIMTHACVYVCSIKFRSVSYFQMIKVPEKKNLYEWMGLFTSSIQQGNSTVKEMQRAAFVYRSWSYWWNQNFGFVAPVIFLLETKTVCQIWCSSVPSEDV